MKKVAESYLLWFLKRINNIAKAILRRPILTAWVVFFAVAALVYVVSADRCFDSNFREGILVEAHGMVLDILVIGILILWLDKKRERVFATERLQNEIDDFRGWLSEEAAHRIRGSIYRLNAEKVSQIDLNDCYLKEMKLRRVNLKGSRCQQADFGKAYLREALFCEAKVDTAYMAYADLRGASFRRASAKRVRFQQSVLRNVDFRECDLTNARFHHADLLNANFIGAKLGGVKFTGAYLRCAKLAGACGLTAAQLLEAATLYRSQLDPPLREEVARLKPELFQEPPVRYTVPWWNGKASVELARPTSSRAEDVRS